MPTQTKENYLKAIYFLDKKSTDISLTHLSREMGVSAPTANNMVKKLQEVGWVIYKKYKPIQLTHEGRQAAALIVRKHRLTEMFLTGIMGFGWEEVHDIAEDIEHVSSEKLFDRMDELLGFPTVDPHGSPIPDKNGKIIEQKYMPLSGVSPGKMVRLMALAESNQELLDYLNRKNIGLGTNLRILSFEPYDKSLEVSYNGIESISLGREVCEHLLVKEIVAST